MSSAEKCSNSKLAKTEFYCIVLKEAHTRSIHMSLHYLNKSILQRSMGHPAYLSNTIHINISFIESYIWTM